MNEDVEAEASSFIAWTTVGRAGGFSDTWSCCRSLCRSKLKVDASQDAEVNESLEAKGEHDNADLLQSWMPQNLLVTVVHGRSGRQPDLLLWDRHRHLNSNQMRRGSKKQCGCDGRPTHETRRRVTIGEEECWMQADMQNPTQQRGSSHAGGVISYCFLIVGMANV